MDIVKVMGSVVGAMKDGAENATQAIGATANTGKTGGEDALRGIIAKLHDGLSGLAKKHGKSTASVFADTVLLFDANGRVRGESDRCLQDALQMRNAVRAGSMIEQRGGHAGANGEGGVAGAKSISAAAVPWTEISALELQIRACSNAFELKSLIARLNAYAQQFPGLAGMLADFIAHAEQREMAMEEAAVAQSEVVLKNAKVHDVMWQSVEENATRIFREERMAVHGIFERDGMDGVQRYIDEKKKKPNGITEGPLSACKDTEAVSKAIKADERNKEALNKTEQKIDDIVRHAAEDPGLKTLKEKQKYVLDETQKLHSEKQVEKIAAQYGVHDTAGVKTLADAMQINQHEVMRQKMEEHGIGHDTTKEQKDVHTEQKGDQKQLDMQQSQQDAQRERQEKTKRRRRFDKMLETIGQSCLTSLGAVVDSKNNPIDSYIDNKSEEKNKITTGPLKSCDKVGDVQQQINTDRTPVEQKVYEKVYGNAVSQIIDQVVKDKTQNTSNTSEKQQMYVLTEIQKLNNDKEVERLAKKYDVQTQDGLDTLNSTCIVNHAKIASQQFVIRDIGNLQEQTEIKKKKKSKLPYLQENGSKKLKQTALNVR